ncbi:hypothetical protein Salat_0674600 [Sesamum alatum]|uniref:Uncharacterized protein n=1 Tax=Sesamum alatum TaxID=300844 RepID=A0AAE1YSA5_9LAMI|nr:hypothetical protein Salat_0674600 [Sesamum alatum]
MGWCCSSPVPGPLRGEGGSQLKLSANAAECRLWRRLAPPILTYRFGVLHPMVVPLRTPCRTIPRTGSRFLCHRTPPYRQRCPKPRPIWQVQMCNPPSQTIQCNGIVDKFTIMINSKSG